MIMMIYFVGGGGLRVAFLLEDYASGPRTDVTFYKQNPTHDNADLGNHHESVNHLTQQH